MLNLQIVCNVLNTCIFKKKSDFYYQILGEGGLRKQFEELITQCHQRDGPFPVFLPHHHLIGKLIQCPNLSENNSGFAGGLISCQLGPLEEPTGPVARCWEEAVA